jgi:hypothetical protein
MEVSRLVEMIENALDCEHETARFCDADVKELAEADDRFVVMDVWTNGRGISRYSGQDKLEERGYIRNRGGEQGYRKMLAILVEVEDE